MPEGVRGASLASPVRPSRGKTRPRAREGRVAAGPDCGPAEATSSWIVFQPLQASQRPRQRL